jgi:hypothetical protein
MKEIALRILQNALRSTRRRNFAICADALNVATAALMQQRCALRAPRLLATLRPPTANANAIAPNPQPPSLAGKGENSPLVIGERLEKNSPLLVGEGLGERFY